MSEEHIEKQVSYDTIDKAITDKDSGTFKDKYIAAMVSSMNPDIDSDKRKLMATEVYEIIEQYLGGIPEKSEPADKLSSLCEGDETSVIELIIEIEGEFDIYLPEDSYLVGSLENRKCELSIGGLANILLNLFYEAEAKAKKKPEYKAL